MKKVHLAETEVSRLVLLDALGNFVAQVPTGEIARYDIARLRNYADVLEMRMDEEDLRISRDKTPE